MTTTPLLTDAKRRALEVMAATHPRPARVSNATVNVAGAALVYWQSADWLVDQGLAQATDAGGLVLTAAGVIAAKAAGSRLPDYDRVVVDATSRYLPALEAEVDRLGEDLRIANEASLVLLAGAADLERRREAAERLCPRCARELDQQSRRVDL